MVVTAENKKFTHPKNEKEDTKTRVIETLFYIQFQGLCLEGWVWEDYLRAVSLHKAQIVPWLSTERTFSKTVNGKRQAYLSSPRAPGESIWAHPDVWFQASEIWVTSDCMFMTKYKQAGDCQTLWTPYLDGTCWLNVYRTRETLPVLPLGRTPPRQAHHSSTAFVQN